MQADQSALWQVDLSAGDLKLQLYDQLKASGVLNALKSRLRTQVLCRLQDDHHGDIPRLNLRPTSLWTRAFESLLLEYFDVYSFGYSASVFRAEAGLGSSSPLSRTDVEEILRVKHHEHLHKALEQSEEPTLAIKLLKATAAISEAQGREGSGLSGCMQSGQGTAATAAAEAQNAKHASQMESLKAIELEALQRLQQQQQKIDAEQRQEAERLQAWQADLATQSAKLQALREQLEARHAGLHGQPSAALHAAEHSQLEVMRSRYREAMQQERAQRDDAVRQAAVLSAELKRLQLHHQHMVTEGPQLIKAVKASGGEHQQPAKRSQWQTLARQLEIRLAMWQRHAAAAEAVAHRARAQQEATGHELEEMQLSLSAVKQERDELRHLLNSTSSAHHKQNASPGKGAVIRPAGRGLPSAGSHPCTSPNAPPPPMSLHLAPTHGRNVKGQRHAEGSAGFIGATYSTDNSGTGNTITGRTSSEGSPEIGFRTAGPRESLHRLRQHAVARRSRRGQGDSHFPAQSGSLDQALSNLSTSFSGSSCESHRTSAASLSAGPALSVPDSQHGIPSPRQQLTSKNASPQRLNIGLPCVPVDPFAPQRSQHERLPASPMRHPNRLPDNSPSHRPSSDGASDESKTMAETALRDYPTPSRHLLAALPYKDGELAPFSSFSVDDADVQLLPDAPQQQQSLSPAESPTVPMRPQEVPQPLASDAVGEDELNKASITSPSQLQDPSSPSQSAQAALMLDMRHVSQQVAVLENRIAETGGHIPSPSKTGRSSVGIAQSPPSRLLQDDKTVDNSSNGTLSAQHEVRKEEGASPETDALCYSRLSEETQDLPPSEAVSAPGPAGMSGTMHGQALAADHELGSMQQDDLSDQSAAHEEQEDLLLSYEQEYNPSGSLSSASLLLA